MLSRFFAFTLAVCGVSALVITDLVAPNDIPPNLADFGKSRVQAACLKSIENAKALTSKSLKGFDSEYYSCDDVKHLCSACASCDEWRDGSSVDVQQKNCLCINSAVTFTLGDKNDCVISTKSSALFGADTAGGDDCIIVSQTSVAGPSAIDGGAGDDTILFLNDDRQNNIRINAVDGGDGEDCIYFGAVPDFDEAFTLSAGSDNDFVLVDENVEAPANMAAQDFHLHGDGDDDFLIVNGNPGYVLIDVYGDAGDDALVANKKGYASNLYGGNGDDIVVVSDAARVYHAVGDLGDDFVDVKKGAWVQSIFGDNAGAVAGGRDFILVEKDAKVGDIYGNYNDDIIEVYANVRTIEGGEGNDYIYAASSVDILSIEGNDGDDYVVLLSSVRVSDVFLGDGNDYFYGAESVYLPTLDAGDGDDIIDFAGSANDIFGSGGEDSIKVHAGAHIQGSVDGGLGDDSLSVDGVVIYDVIGGEGLDSLHVGSNARVDYVSGGEGSDHIIVSGQANYVYGDGGDDVIHIESSATVFYGVQGDVGDDAITVESSASVVGLVYGGNNAGDQCRVPEDIAVGGCPALSVFSSSSSSSSS